MIRRFSLWIGKDTLLTSDTGHESWLVAARKKDWRYWPRYRQWLDGSLSIKAIEAMDESTGTVLGLLEDPSRPGPWDRRGLVVGQIQSGKTGHYTGLVCKAADAGYKIVIVLAGLHNNLRSQTQMRLDEGFLGYETRPNEKDIEPIGVGKIDTDPSIRPNFATNRTNTGDFTTRVARNLESRRSNGPGCSWSRRTRLYWTASCAGSETMSPTTMIGRVAEGSFSSFRCCWSTTRPTMPASTPESRSLTRTDGLTTSTSRQRSIAWCAAYFIRSRGRRTSDILRPRSRTYSFTNEAPRRAKVPICSRRDSLRILRLLRTTWGGKGFRPGEKTAGGARDDLNLVRTIDDHSTDESTGWMPVRHKNGHLPRFQGRDMLPPSLNEAIDAFLLACTARRLRGHANRHSSMLIHVTRFNSVQNEVYRQVVARVGFLRQRLRRRIGVVRILERMESLWQRDFAATTHRVGETDPELVPRNDIRWAEMLSLLPDVVSDVQVRMINGTAKDALDYKEHDRTGLTVIAIGGDKLSRGLTLEGLCVSYFLRASRMYDTLMQMGRWFGYRPGYLDLCRLYTTSDLSEWFGHITAAADELREEFDYMAASGATPRDFGLKVQSHPVLMVTSRLKMRTARNLLLSFSGTLLETVALYRGKAELERNLSVTKELIGSLGSPEADPERRRGGRREQWKGSWLWQDVPAARILEFLTDYRTHPDVHKVSSALLTEFIRKMLPHGELTRWTIVLVGGGEGAEVHLRHDVKVRMLKRTRKTLEENRYSIGRLLSPRDEGIDLDDAEWNAAVELTAAWAERKNAVAPKAPAGPAIRRVRGFGAAGLPGRPDRGLLFLSLLDPQKAEAGFSGDTPPIAGFAVSFPSSSRDERVEYKVNNVLWEQEYGSAD